MSLLRNSLVALNEGIPGIRVLQPMYVEAVAKAEIPLNTELKGVF